MAKNWGDYFSEGFSQSYGDSRKIQFEKWKQEQEQGKMDFEKWKQEQTNNIAQNRTDVSMANLGFRPVANPAIANYRKMVSGGQVIPNSNFGLPTTNIGQNNYIQSPNLLSAIGNTKSRNTIDPTYAKSIADAIVSGDQPPEMKGLYRYGGAVKGELAKQKFDLTKATRDWQAVTKTISGLNSTQQVRMRQALESVDQGLPMLDQLNGELQRSGLKDVNWVTVNAALRGVGPQRDVATRYVGQINLMKDELAQAFMGGGVPSDQAFKLTHEILQPLYGKEQMSAALTQLAYNIKIRKSAISSITPLSTSGEVINPKMTGNMGYMKTGTNSKGQRVGMKKDGTIEVIK